MHANTHNTNPPLICLIWSAQDLGAGHQSAKIAEVPPETRFRAFGAVSLEFTGFVASNLRKTNNWEYIRNRSLESQVKFSVIKKRNWKYVSIYFLCCNLLPAIALFPCWRYLWHQLHFEFSRNGDFFSDNIFEVASLLDQSLDKLDALAAKVWSFIN